MSLLLTFYAYSLLYGSMDKVLMPFMVHQNLRPCANHFAPLLSDLNLFLLLDRVYLLIVISIA